MSVTQPLRDEHKELYPQVELIKEAADAIGVDPQPALDAKIGAAYEFLSHHLIPHATAEEQALYPVVATAMGAPEATRTMSRDHVEVGRLTEELSALRKAPGDPNALRQVLYGLYTLVKVHFAKEEEVYLPLLDARLSEQEAQAMFGRMEAAAHRAKSDLGG